MKENQKKNYIEMFLEYATAILNLSPLTIKEYRYDLLNFFKFTQNHRNIEETDDYSNIVLQITTDDILKYLTYLALHKKTSTSTRCRKLATLKSFYNYLEQQNFIEHNPTKKVIAPKREKKEPAYLTLAECKRLLKHVENNKNNKNRIRDYAIITTFLNCALRLRELVNIDIQDFNLRERTLVVKGKGNKERIIYMNDATINAIFNYIQEERVPIVKENALFLSERHERISPRMVQYVVRRAIEEVGLDYRKYTAHKLRHTCATIMYRYGHTDLRTLQQFLGHENVHTTEIYVHVNDKSLMLATTKNPLSKIGVDNKKMVC